MKKSLKRYRLNIISEESYNEQVRELYGKLTEELSHTLLSVGFLGEYVSNRINNDVDEGRFNFDVSNKMDHKLEFFTDLLEGQMM